MKIDFYNSPTPGSMDTAKLPTDVPFLGYVPDFKLLEDYARTYGQYKNILIIANGGSSNPFYGLYAALGENAKCKAYFLNTLDPDYIFELKQRLKPKDTLVLSISKSGENIQQLEATMQFLEYPMLVITGQSSPLRTIAEKLKLKVILHPPIGGRYTGLTEVALLPAALCGLDAREIYEGGRKLLAEYKKDNAAWRAASIFWQLEQNGFVDVLMFFYSHALYPMSFPIIQLCHESFGKGELGQTYFAHEGPEVQHHTTQRFYGGRKNIAGMFFTVDNFLHPTPNIYPAAVHSVQMKSHHLADIDKIPLEKSLEFEWTANMEDARIQGIPFMHTSVLGFLPEEMGGMLAFWQLYAVYASVLRGENPFDQPQVESSKNIAFNKRLEFKGLL